MTRFSANLGFLWPEYPLLERIDRAAASGFRAVELHWPYDVPAEAVRDRCARYSLALVALNTPTGEASKGEFGLAALPGRERDFEAGFDQALTYCKIAGAKAIHVMAGVVREAERAEARDVFAANLAKAAATAAGEDVKLLLEPINPRDRPNYFYSRVDEAAALIETVGNGAVRLMFDVYHVGVTEGDVLTKLRHYMPLIEHVQIAAVPSRAEPDEGEIAYRAIFNELEALDYRGWVGCEYRPRATTEQGLAWMEAMTRGQT